MGDGSMLAAPRLPIKRPCYTSSNMNPILRVLLGIAVMAVGGGIVYKTDLLRSWLGNVDWAEEHLGSGGTRLFYKLAGVMVCFIGIMITTNMISDILNGIASIFVHPAAV